MHPYRISDRCPICRSENYKATRPNFLVAFRPDRICVECQTRYTPPTPLWGALLLVLIGGVFTIGSCYAYFERYVGLLIFLGLFVLGIACIFHGIRAFSNNDGSKKFTADNVEADPEAGLVQFADTANNRYFRMQRGEYTTAKGEIWLERDNERWGGSGDKWTVILRRDSILVDTQHLSALGCRAVEVEFSMDDSTFESLKSTIQEIMLDCREDVSLQLQTNATLMNRLQHSVRNRS